MLDKQIKLTLSTVINSKDELLSSGPVKAVKHPPFQTVIHALIDFVFLQRHVKS